MNSAVPPDHGFFPSPPWGERCHLRSRYELPHSSHASCCWRPEPPVSSSSPGSTCACAQQLAPYSSPSPLLTALGEGEVRRGEPEQGLSQCSGGPRARPPPSLPHGPIGIYYNVVASRGGGARAGRGPRRPRLAEERREGARRGCSLARSLALSRSPSLPPSAGGFSQLACSPPAREPQRAGASDAGAASCHCSSG